MRIVDSHVHLFDRISGITQGQPMRSDRHGRVLIGNHPYQQLPPSFTNSDSRYETLLAYMDWCGISHGLLVPNPLYGYFNAYFMEAIQHAPERLKGVALVDILKGEAAARELQTLYDTTPLFGLKIEVNSTFQCAPDKHILSDEVQPVLDCLNQNRQPLLIHMLHREDIQRVNVLKDRYPHITWVLCHMGADAFLGHGYDEDAYDEILTMVQSCPRIYLETSTVLFYFDEEYPFPTARRIIQRGYRRVGADKMMWGSDYPGLLTRATMPQLIKLVAEECDEIPLADRETILGKTAYRLFFEEEFRKA